MKTLQHDNQKYFKLQVQQLKEALADSKKSPLEDNTAKLSRGVPTPESFTGQGHDDFASWLTQFLAIAKLNKWTPPVCADLLQTFLKDCALTYVLSLPQETRSNFETAVAALCAHFDDTTVRQSLHIELHNRKQKLHESVDDFTHDLEKTFLRLNVNENYYKLLVFLDGLQPHHQYEIRKFGPPTYDKAKKLARNIEAALIEQSCCTVSAVSTLKPDSNDNIELKQQLDFIEKQFKQM